MLVREEIEKSGSLDARAVVANDSEDEAKTLIEEFLPFLRGRVAKYAMRFDEHVQEDVYSVAMMALYEAIQNYDIGKGHFFPFANRVVSARIIDHIRKISRHHGKTVSLSEEDSQQQAQSAIISEVSIRNFNEERRRERMAEEIEQFRSEISTWGITMDDLVKSSPKHRHLRDTYKEIISTVMNNHDIMQTINLKRYFPIKAISIISGLPQKKLERARTFILASLVIKTGDYDLLSEYSCG